MWHFFLKRPWSRTSIAACLLVCTKSKVIWPKVTPTPFDDTTTYTMPTPPHRILTHIRNTARAALGSTSLPYSNAALGISAVLLRHGLLTNVSLGGPTHPAPADFPKLPVPARRLWIGHKYRAGQPVLRHIDLISKPSVRRGANHEQLGLLLQGKRVNNVPGVGTGEILIVKVPKDGSMGRKGVDMYMEGWEAYTAGLGGELIARAS